MNIKKYFRNIKSKKIAVIGSSKIILRKNHNKTIDQFCEVVRFNRAILKNYEKYVGNKTHTFCINNAVFCCSPAKNRKWKIDTNFARKIKNKKIFVISPWRIKKKTKKLFSSRFNDYFFCDSLLLNKFIFIFFFRYPKIFSILLFILILKNKFLSVGLFYILLAVIFKKKPYIYGFDLNENMNSRSHYWENISHIKVNKQHSYDYEKKILFELQKNNLIKINT